MPSPRIRALIVDNDQQPFLAHRLPLVDALLGLGMDVHALVPGLDGADLAGREVTLHELAYHRDGMHPVREAGVIFRMARVISRLQPELIYLRTPKICSYGSMVARWLGHSSVICHFTGIGFMSGASRRAHLAKSVASWCSRVGGGNPRLRVVVENADDREFVARMGWPLAKIKVVLGATGVPAQRYSAQPPSSSRMAVLPARMLADKGIGEFVAAARIVKARHRDYRFVLVGPIDAANPMAISKARIDAWVHEGIVEHWGYRADMMDVYRQAQVVCLPSYREGFPRVLLEASSCERAVVTVDTTGCRDAVIPGLTGLMTANGDIQALAEALEGLLGDPSRCHAMGRAGRAMVMDRFDSPATTARMLDVIDEILPDFPKRVAANRWNPDEMLARSA